MAAKTDDLSKLLPTAQEMMEKLALAEAEKAEAAARKHAEAEAEKKQLLDKITKPSGVSDEEAMKRGLRGAQYFGFSLAFTNGEVHHGKDHLNRTFTEKFGREGEEKPMVEPEQEPEDETQRTLARAGGRGLFIGSPAFVRENLRRYEDAHVDLMNWQIQGGFRKHEHIMETIEMFAKEVMPEFQERHHKHEKWREQQLDGFTHPVNSTV
jgi:alkanesulfonate monooxygenase SsuD/methylene tetrahydromethanopterin reductase-like flavin-dependent oxidoreductase (luciferase family)